MKTNNQTAILRELCRRSMSCSEIARKLGLTRASVSNHVNELMSCGLVQEKGAGECEYKGRGRKPILLDIDPGYGYIGGLYISRGACYTGLTDMKGRILISEPTPRNENASPMEIISSAASVWERQIVKLRIEYEKIIGMGVSVPGPVDTRNGVMLTPPGFEQWSNFPIKSLLSGMTGIETVIGNNAISRTLAEMKFGHGRDIADFIYLVIDSGIGGGLVFGGNLYQGKDEFGSEIGHTSIMMGGRLCSCGNTGCVERYASIPALLSEAFSNEEGMDSWSRVVDAAEAGDERCMIAMEREADYLAAALVNFVNVLEPEAVIFGGDLLYRPSRITRLLHDSIHGRIIMRGSRGISILPSALRDETGVQAAATLILDKFYSRGARRREV